MGGRSYPDPRSVVQGSLGADLIIGKLIQNGVVGTEWDYNSYAIYDPKQIRIRYAVLVELTGKDSQRYAEPQHLPYGQPIARGIWKFASGKNWVAYDNDLCNRIEESYQRQQKIFNVVIANTNYTINLDHMVQYQTQNPKKSRKIKRE